MTCLRIRSISASSARTPATCIARTASAARVDYSICRSSCATRRSRGERFRRTCSRETSMRSSSSSRTNATRSRRSRRSSRSSGGRLNNHRRRVCECTLTRPPPRQGAPRLNGAIVESRAARWACGVRRARVSQRLPGPVTHHISSMTAVTSEACSPPEHAGVSPNGGPVAAVDGSLADWGETLAAHGLRSGPRP